MCTSVCTCDVYYIACGVPPHGIDEGID